MIENKLIILIIFISLSTFTLSCDKSRSDLDSEYIQLLLDSDEAKQVDDDTKTALIKLNSAIKVAVHFYKEHEKSTNLLEEISSLRQLKELYELELEMENSNY